MEYIEAETCFMFRPFPKGVDVGERIALNQFDLFRACPAFPDFQNVNGSPNRIQGEPGYSDRPSKVKARPSLHFGLPSSVSGHGKAGASASVIHKTDIKRRA